MTGPPQRLPHVSPARVARLQRLFAILQTISPGLAARVAFWIFLRPFRRPLRTEDAAILAQGQRHQLHAGRDAFVVHEWGSGDRTVIILHGWGSSAARFTQMAATLASQGWHVLAIDAPGHGGSPGRSSSLPQFMAALDATADRFGSPLALIGHSLGALAIACRHTSNRPSWNQRLAAVVLISMPSGAPFLVDSFLQLLKIDSRTAQQLLQQFHRRFGAGPERYTVLPGAGRLPARVLLAHDRDDDIVPFAHTASLQPLVPDSQLLESSGLGHSNLTRDAGTIARICAFLATESSS